MVYIYTGLDTIRFFHFTLPIPIFKKKIFPDPIIDQILDQNYDQIPIIDPIKNKRHLPKKKAFFASDKFYSSLWKWTAYQSLLHIFTHFKKNKLPNMVGGNGMVSAGVWPLINTEYNI
jgi:hypothetical protein